MAGVDIKTVQELLGHKTLIMTLRYAHLSPDHKKRAVEVLCNKLGTNEAQEPKVENVDSKH
jgi:integrase